MEQHEHQSHDGQHQRQLGICSDRETGHWNHRTSDEQGQGLIGYTLLIEFVALAFAPVFIVTGSSISGIWGSSNTQLTSANPSAS